MISYAQNREDVVLARAFAGRRKGFYIDIGAEHPTAFSVTKHLYDLGWRGINVEPAPSSFALLEQERPGDVNLAVGVGAAVGTATLFEGPPESHGSSTFDVRLAEELSARGHVVQPIPEVPITTLALICKEWVGDRDIDLLKIDVEGWEREVIEGADWDRWRPRVVVVEATVPDTTVPSHADWEPTLLDAGYVCTLFDGLNRFYCQAGDAELLGPLSVPANVLDDWIDFKVVEELRALREQLGLEVAARQAAEGEHRRTIARLQEVEAAVAATADIEAQWREARREQHLALDRVAQLEEELAFHDVEAVALRRRLALLEQQVEASKMAVLERDLLLQTKTYRWSRALRNLYAWARRP